MKRIVLAAAAAGLVTMSPLAVQAQSETGSQYSGPSAPTGVRESLDRLGARIDHGLAQGQLSQKEADEARRRTNDIAAQFNTDRERDGGRLSEADRFDLMAQIEHLGGEIRWQRGEATASPADWTLERREQWVGERIQRAMADGRLSGNEDQRGRGELDAIHEEQARLVARDGGALSEPDRAYLANRIDQLNGSLHWDGPNTSPPWN